MKNIFKFISLVTLTLSLTGCYEIDQINPNQLSEGTFWKTENDMQLGGIAAYDALQSNDMYRALLQVAYSGLSDEGTNEQPFEFNDYVRFRNTNTDGFGRRAWVGNYALIGRAFQVLDRLPAFNLPILEGEMQFLIALGYFNLVGYFGENVAYVDRIQEGFDRPNTAENGEIYALMENMLLEAISKLPLSGEIPSGDYGRASKGTAQALLAKIYLQQEKYAEAEPLLKDVIDSGQYSLLPDFANNFTETNTINQEAIFVVNFLENGTVDNTDVSRRFLIFAIAEENGAFGDLQATNLMLNAFNAEEVASGSKDYRMDHTIIHPNSSLTYYGLSGETWASLGPNPDLPTGFMKYSEQDAVANNTDPITGQFTNRAKDFDGGTDYIVLRYADVLLMYAEVLNNKGQTAQAVPFVDQVRTRASRPGLLTAYPGATASQTAFLEQIKHERILELSGENWRFFDLKRWGMYNNTNQVNDENFATFTDGKNEVEGIPQSELDINSNLRPNQAN